VNHDYADIRDLISKAPVWFDENAVPRYCEFGPKHVANIYADECVLLRIECQACGQEFDVAMSRDGSGEMVAEAMGGHAMPALSMQIVRKSIGYGDPPRGCCDSGATMTSESVQVLQYWQRVNHEWTRERSCEVSVDTRDDVDDS
jgi:hypothetical protein